MAFSFNTTKTEITLNKQAYIDLLDIDFDDHSTSLIIAGTGTGKTTAVTEQLSQRYELVIFALPSTTKVQELENEQKNLFKKTAVKSQYYYDKYQPEASKLEGFNGVIVCTYDKFCKIDSLIDKARRVKTLVVIDECHKMYATGSFRDEALLPMICTLQRNKYQHILYTTATFTPERWPILDLPIHHVINLKQPQTDARALEVISLPKGDQYSYIELIIKRIEHLKAQKRQGKILVRINNKRQCEMLANFLEDIYRLKCLVVHGNSKNEADVQSIFKKQAIPHHVDVVISTSIFDEGINLKNEDGSIDSVFVIGKSAHVEELVQFIGRLRVANAPCFLVTHTPIDLTPLTKRQLTSFHRQAQDSVDSLMAKVKQIADLICSADHELMQFKDDLSTILSEEDSEHNIVQTVDELTYDIKSKLAKLNATFINWCDAKLFGIHRHRILPNYPSLAALGYRLDKAKCYENFSYLQYRLNVLAPHIQTTYSVDNDITTSEAVKSYYKEQDVINQQALADSLDDAFKIFLEKYIGSDLEDKAFNTELTKRAVVFQEALSNDDNYLKDLVVKNKVAHANACTQNLFQISALALQIGNLHHIKAIISENEYKKVMHISHAYKHDKLIGFLMNYFNTRYHKTIETKGLPISAKDAEKYLILGFKHLSEHLNLPMESIIRKSLLKGVRYDKKAKQIQIQPSKALNFFKHHFDVQEINAHKKHRSLILKSLKFKDYHFTTMENLFPSNISNIAPFHVFNKEYDALTGVCTDQPNTLEDYDYFDEFEDDETKDVTIASVEHPTISENTCQPLRKITLAEAVEGRPVMSNDDSELPTQHNTNFLSCDNPVDSKDTTSHFSDFNETDDDNYQELDDD